ncbi:hypothetical protein IOC61_07600 [Halomonas sp. KAO]|uniref:hypothetical protein n=1 Tax=unclassified Halomonas TaxID=2609666 RepID=UPI00189F1E74|nr:MULTISPECIES: hypothetical protein [unclassified Halomonas]MBF7053187.1 hypothetical protein [Halomonas sp. KAO]MDT0499424.1 hypothetical protein [Halomonas sp. PAR7]MDT0510759.1 hypothetical protein [Halomonas sp. LES1]MDT0591712.1 hypothetical protein [Halomonas sp. PAR8]
MKTLMALGCIAFATGVSMTPTADAGDLHLESEFGQVSPSFVVNNLARTDQDGISHEANIFQSGQGQEALIVQRGYYNLAEIDQVGQQHDAAVLQAGGYLEASIAQSGYGHGATIEQRGVGKQASIVQSGVHGSASIMQVGSTRRAPVEVIQHSRGQAAIQVIQH